MKNGLPAGLSDFSWYNITKWEKYTKISTQHTKISTKYTKISTKYTKISTKYTKISTKYTKISTKYTKISTKYTKWPLNIPNSSKVDQMVLNFNNILHCETLQNLPKFGLLV
jgi:hypothetical protein